MKRGRHKDITVGGKCVASCGAQQQKCGENPHVEGDVCEKDSKPMLWFHDANHARNKSYHNLGNGTHGLHLNFHGLAWLDVVQRPILRLLLRHASS
jgi:hypothetical protein